MATTWSRNKVDSNNINNGNEYELGDRVSRQNLNAMVNSGLYSQDFAEHLADTPDTSQAGQVGTPSVSLIDNVVGGKTYKKFKFDNLKGNQGETGYSILYSNLANTSSSTQTIEINTVTIPTGYIVKVGDMILCLDGNLFKITAPGSQYYVSYLTSLKGTGGGVVTEDIKFSQILTRIQNIGADKITAIKIASASVPRYINLDQYNTQITSSRVSYTTYSVSRALPVNSIFKTKAIENADNSPFLYLECNQYVLKITNDSIWFTMNLEIVQDRTSVTINQYNETDISNLYYPEFANIDVTLYYTI